MSISSDFLYYIATINPARLNLIQQYDGCTTFVRRCAEATRMTNDETPPKALGVTDGQSASVVRL